MKGSIVIIILSGIAGWYVGGTSTREQQLARPVPVAQLPPAQLPEEVPIPDSFEAGILALAGMEPSAAFSKVNSGRDMEGETRKLLLEKILLGWCGRSGAAEVWEFLLRPKNPLLPVDQGTYLRSAVLNYWLEEDLSAAIAAVTQLDPIQFGRDGGIQLAKDLAKFAPLEAADWVVRLHREKTVLGETDYNRNRITNEVLSQIVGGYPEKVTEILEEGFPGKDHERRSRLSAVIGSWALTDEKAAFEWLFANESPGKIRTQILESVGLRLRNNRDIEGVYGFLETPGLTGDEKIAILRRAANMATFDLPRFLEIALEIPGADPLPMLGKVAEELFEHGHFEDGRAVVEEMQRAGSLSIADQAMVAAWARNDPGSTATWLATLPEGETANLGTLNLSAALARVEPARAEAYLATLPEGDRRREFAALGIAMELAYYDPGLAFRSLDSVTDPELLHDFYVRRPGSVVRFAPERVESLLAHEDPTIAAAIRKELQMQAFLTAEK